MEGAHSSALELHNARAPSPAPTLPIPPHQADAGADHAAALPSMLRGKSPPLVPTTWLMVTLMVVDPPSCEAHMIVVSDVHAVDEHTAASDAVGLGSEIPKFMPLKVKLVPLPTLAGAFAAAEPIVSTGAAVATPSAAALGPTLIGPRTVFAEAEKDRSAPSYVSQLGSDPI